MLDASFSNLILIPSSPGDFLVLTSLSAPIVSWSVMLVLRNNLFLMNCAVQKGKKSSDI
jgi:hypothetical protein